MNQSSNQPSNKEVAEFMEAHGFTLHKGTRPYNFDGTWEKGELQFDGKQAAFMCQAQKAAVAEAQKDYRQYNRGYNKAMSKIKHISEKYAQMWAESNAWIIPAKLHMSVRSQYDTPERIFISGMWAVLESLRNDGLIPEVLIDKHWAMITNTKQQLNQEGE